MWCGDVDFGHLDNRLSDYVIPNGSARPWLDPDTTPLTRIALPLTASLASETVALVNGTIELPPYAQDDLEWNATKGVGWGRGTLFKAGRARSNLDTDYPSAGRVLREAIALGRLVNLAFLSLAPGEGIPRHADGFPIFASWHMGISVPPACTLKVGQETRMHQAGKALMFDDSFFHSAWNRGDRVRLVLSGWVIHPDFTDGEARALSAVTGLLGWGT
jgi:aspartyl/asparaginyl beta-hydroxylase (cupin superfamily)